MSFCLECHREPDKLPAALTPGRVQPGFRAAVLQGGDQEAEHGKTFEHDWNLKAAASCSGCPIDETQFSASRTVRR